MSLVPAVVSQLTVPAIYNGDVFYHDDIARMKKATGASSAMIARGGTYAHQPPCNDCDPR